MIQEVSGEGDRKLARRDPDESSFRTGLYRVVSNRVTDMKTRGYEAAVTGIESSYSFVTQEIFHFDDIGGKPS